MAATIKQIAELAGVSIGTVDRALHKREGIRPEVRDRILEIAESLDYKANAMAKAMVLKRKNPRIGLLLHVQVNDFFKEMIRGINAAAEEIRDSGISVTIRCGKNYDADDQLRLMEEMLAEGIQALVLVPLRDNRVTERIRLLREIGFPVVFLFSPAENAEALAFVGCDFEKVGRIAAGLIGTITGGHARVLYGTSSLNMLGNLERLNGFRRTLAERYPGLSLTKVAEFDNDDRLAYKKAVEEFQLPDYDVFMMATGAKTGIFRAFEEAGLHGKVKVVALDTSEPVLEAFRKGVITATIDQRPYRQGYQVIRLLYEYLLSGAIPPKEDCIVESDIKIYENFNG